MKPLRLRPDLAPWDEIKMYYDETKGDKMIDLTELETFEEDPTLLNQETKEINTRKVIQVNRLFGSNKNAGVLPGLVRKPFSGHRIDKRVYPKKRNNTSSNSVQSSVVNTSE